MPTRRQATIELERRYHRGATEVLDRLRRAKAERGRSKTTGKDSPPEQSQDGGLGLAGMRERVALLEGRLEIESAPGSGTTLIADVLLS